MITEQIDRRRPLPDLSGDITARQAFAIAQPAAQAYDAEARLVQIKSDPSIDQHGRASFWELWFDLPNEQAQVFLYVRWHSNRASSQFGSGELRELIRPFIPHDSVVRQVIREGQLPPGYAGTIPGNAIEELLRQGELGESWPERQWQRELASRPALPTPFRDSPEAVQALIEQGADFETGPTDLQLESRVLPGGQALWWVKSYQEYTTPFAD
jgi:hypothetical protein